MTGLLAHGSDGARGAVEAAQPWAWHFHPDVWILMLLIGSLYFGAARLWSDGGAVSKRQKLLFGAGLITLWLASDYPVHDIAENYLLSVHMGQHLAMTFIAPPLLLAGLPTWMLEEIVVRPRRVHAVVGQLSRPLIAALIFNVVTVLTHWPLVVNAALDYHLLHLAVHAVLISTAFLMWLPVMNRSEHLPRAEGLFAMAYLFLQSVIPTIPASFITFAESPVYRFYAEAPRPFSVSVIDDQQIAGVMMKIGGGLLLWTMIVVIFFRWYGEESAAGRGKSLRQDANSKALL